MGEPHLVVLLDCSGEINVQPECDQSNIDPCSDELLLGPQVWDDGFQKVSRLSTHLPDFCGVCIYVCLCVCMYMYMFVLL